MKSNDNFITQVLLENRRRERRLSDYACKSRNAIRKHPEQVPDDKNIRPAFTHDTDRIIHSQAYSRYIDKTQVFYLFENDHITHRVLHVQFVSKIGRTIGRALKLNEDLIEAIALGHDLGHVPYGHDGESILNKICQKKKIGGFAHNVQSVRCLTSIEKSGEGLNLSLQVLDGILAHNGEMLKEMYIPQYGKTLDESEKEYHDCLQDIANCRNVRPMTLEGCVVRISDVIAYIGRDIEDAFTIELIKPADIPSDIRSVLGDNNREIIHNLIMDLIEHSYGKPHLEFSSNVFKALGKLKDFNYKKIYHNRNVKTESYKIDGMFNSLFRKYLQDMKRIKPITKIRNEYLTGMSDKYHQTTSDSRIVSDYISGMTDDFFNNQYKTLFVPSNQGYTVNSR